MKDQCDIEYCLIINGPHSKFDKYIHPETNQGGDAEMKADGEIPTPRTREQIITATPRTFEASKPLSQLWRYSDPGQTFVPSEVSGSIEEELAQAKAELQQREERIRELEANDKRWETAINCWKEMAGEFQEQAEKRESKNRALRELLGWCKGLIKEKLVGKLSGDSSVKQYCEELIIEIDKALAASPQPAQEQGEQGEQWRATSGLPHPDTYQAGDWPEDATQENGNYRNQCVKCSDHFIGNKYRRICKICATPLPQPPKEEA